MSKIQCFLLAVLAAATVINAPASAQQMSMPQLVVPAEEKAEPLKLSAVRTEVQILGYLAQTKMTMTFYNPNNRVLAGDLYFPLPEGATVSGYALDVGGGMVDGVVVEKHKGRQVFEKIVRQGIDPGLVEWVKGNNFKTRVFPILARGTRTVMVRYVSELIHDPKGTTYHLPLNFKNPVDEFSLRVEVVKPAAKPVISQGELANFSFEKWQDSYVAETTLKNQTLEKNLVIALPDVERRKVLVEKDPDGEYYFVINDFPKPPDKDKAALERKSPSRIVLFWDASGSRGKSDHNRELKLLEKYLSKQSSKKVQVDLVLFRNEAEKAQRFVIEKGNSEKLIAALSSVEYDGGTQIGSLSPDAASGAPDLYLLFSDGLSNFGKEEPTGFKAPIYALSGDSSTNHSFLRYLCRQTGGEYFNLDRVDEETVLSRIGTSSYSFISAASEGTGTEDVYPKASQPAYGRFAVVGKLRGEKAQISLNYGIRGKVLNKVQYEISRSDASEGSLLRLYWAQKKIDELQVFLKSNEKELVVIGKDHGLVTPGTSLIVLESLQQYVEHKIAPPKSLPDMRARYLAMIDSQQHKEQRRVTDKLEQVVAMWQKRVDWWNTEFKAPKDFKYNPADTQSGMKRGGQPGSRPQAQRYTAPPPVPGPPPIVGPADSTYKVIREQTAPTPARLRRERVVAPYQGGVAWPRPGKNDGDAEHGQSVPESTTRSDRSTATRRPMVSAPGTSVGSDEEVSLERGVEPAEEPPSNEAPSAPRPTAPAPGASPTDERVRMPAATADARLDPSRQRKTERAEFKSDAGAREMSPDVRRLEQAPTKARGWRENGTAKVLEPTEPASGGQTDKLAVQPSSEGSISIRAWDPSTPYLSELKGAKPETYLKVYMEQRKKFGTSPAFFLDCANFFFEQKQESLAVRVLSNIAELDLENPQLLRVMGHRLAQANMLEPARMVFEEILRLRPEEPQSLRDLALVLDSLKQYGRAVDLLYQVVTSKWDRFQEIEIPVLMELNRTIARAKRAGMKDFPVDPRLIKLLDVDVRIVLTWDADMTDVDLWVIEPSDEKAYYHRKLTTIGGLVSRDITDGYGPEEYVLKKAMPGRYQVQANYFVSGAPSLAGAVTLQADVFTNYGRPDEKRRSITLRLKQRREVVTVGDIDFK